MMTTKNCLITESDNYDALNSKTRYESHRGGADARGRVPSRVGVFSGDSVHLVGGDRRLCNEKGNRYEDNDRGKLQYHLDHESKFIVTRKLFVMNHKSFTSCCLVVPGANIS